MEEWRNIKGYENLYQISNKGKIRRILFINNVCQKNKIKELKPTDNGNGYKIIGLCRNNKKKSAYIHRLVAQMFLENPNNYKEVNHKDFDKSNNSVENLEWCNRKYNMKYSRDRGRMKKISINHCIGRRGKLCPTAKVAKQYDKNMNFIKEYESALIASEETGIDYSSIKDCRRGKSKTAGGYIWTY